MNAPLSLPQFDRDTNMRRVAREIAMDIHPLDKILENCQVPVSEFNRWKEHHQFLKYLREFQDEWNSTASTHERVKIKAGVVMEEFMEEAYTQLHNNKLPLNHRVELGKLVAKIAGMGEPKFNAIAAAGGGFSLTINVSNQPTSNPRDRLVIFPEVNKVIDHDDGYDPFTSPDTLGDA